MKHHSLIIGLSVLALQSCTDNLIYTEPDNEAILTGNTYKAAFTESPSADQSFTLSSGSQILLNASGSLQINNKTLTYIGNQWKAENDLKWNDETGSTHVTALYPVYSNSAYTKENLYKSNSLEDILYVKDEFPSGTSISLYFKHLFSLLTIHLNEELQNGFQKMEITCPAVVSAIAPESAEIALAYNETHITSITQASSSGNYSFIVPPVENITITIDIQTDGKKYTTQLESKSFIGNQEYTYNLKTSEKTPGIVTAEDWIAFSQLINHKNLTEYNGKTLKDFGKTVDGVTTYYLLNDIDFEGVDCTKLEQIKKADEFNDVFDGQKHTISNLTPKSGNSTTGLFAKTGKTGIIKHLYMNSCSVTIDTTPGSKLGVGIIAGINSGMITNCSVTNGTIIATAQPTPTGGITGESRGTIINCNVNNMVIKSETSSCGAITGHSQGYILNCYSANNILYSKSGYYGGISGKGYSSPTYIYNCYVYNNTSSKKNGGMFYGLTNNSIYNHSFYETFKSDMDYLIYTGTNNIKSDIFEYESHFTYNSTPIYQLLNQWIDETAPTLYPDLNFTRWTDGKENLPAVFVLEAR